MSILPKAPPSTESKLCIRPREAPGPTRALKYFRILSRAGIPPLKSLGKSLRCLRDFFKLFVKLFSYCMCVHIFQKQDPYLLG